MAKLRFNITMSLDGYVAGPGQSLENRLASAGSGCTEIHVVPVFLGGGSRLFENLDGGPAGYECVGLVSSPAVAHYAYVRKDGA